MCRNKKEAINESDKKLLERRLIDKEYNENCVIYLDLGNAKRFQDDYDKAIKINPNNSLSYSNRGDAKYFLNDLQGAIDDFNQAITIDKEFISPYLGRAWVNYLQGDFKNAIKDSTKALNLDTEDYSALTTLGRSQYKIGNIKDACSNLKKALSFDIDELEDHLKQNTKSYLESTEGTWCQNQ